MKNQSHENKRSPRKRIVNFLVHVLLAVLALIWVMPIVWIVLTSFRAEPGAYTNTFLPKSYTLNNYVKLLTDRNVLNFPRMFKNTLIIAICSCLISTSFVLSVSYSLSRMRFRMRKPYMNMAMILGLFPGFMTMIAQYFILKAMGLVPVWASRYRRAFSIRFPKRSTRRRSSTALHDGRSLPRSPCRFPNRSSFTLS